MAHDFNGTSQYLISSATIPALSGSYSYHLRFRTDHVPQTGGATVTEIPVAITWIGAGTDMGIIYDHADGAQYRSAFHRQADDVYKFAQLVADPAVDTWHSLTVTYDTTTVRFYVDGVEGANVAATAASGANAPNVVLGAYRPGFAIAPSNSFMNGQMAEFAIWTVALSVAQVESLSDGFSPIAVMQPGLILYWPLINSVIPVVGPAVTTTNQGTAFTHPLAYMLDNGIDAIRSINSATPASVSVSWSSSFIMDGDEQLIVQKLENAAVFTATFIPPERFDHLTSSVSFKSRFRPRATELSTRRSGAYTTR